MRRRFFLAVLSLLFLSGVSCVAAAAPIHGRIDAAARRVESTVIATRRDIHQHPELGNREVRTARLVADRLRALGLEVRTGVAHTGVVGVLRGGRGGRVVALRADMDALPLAQLAVDDLRGG